MLRAILSVFAFLSLPACGSADQQHPAPAAPARPAPERPASVADVTRESPTTSSGPVIVPRSNRWRRLPHSVSPQAQAFVMPNRALA